MKTSISLLSIYSIFLSWGAHMESRKLLSIVSFTGLPQNGFLSSPFQSTFFPSLKIISALPCERRIISPPSPCKYWVSGKVPGAEAWRMTRSDQSPHFQQSLSWGESDHKQHTSVIGAALDCDALRKTKDVRSKDQGSHSSEGWPKEARVQHLPKDFKGVFLPPVWALQVMERAQDWSWGCLMCPGSFKEGSRLGLPLKEESTGWNQGGRRIWQRAKC